MAIQQVSSVEHHYAIQPPALGATILYRGLSNVVCEGVVTQLKHIETRTNGPDKWGAFLDTIDGAIFIQDWRYLYSK